MQGIESLNNFKSFVSTLGGLGRFEDTYMVHAAEGETVVPMEVLNSNPLLKERLFESMRDMGIQPERYIVGNKFNSINPVTGQPEFFLKKIVSQIRKAMPGDSEKYLGAAVGALTGNPFYGALAGGVGSGVGGALTGGAAGAMLPGFSGLGGQASGLTQYLKGMAPGKMLTKAGVGVDKILPGMGKYISSPSEILKKVGGLGSLGTKLLGGGDQMTKEEIMQAVKDKTISPEVGDFLLKNAGGNNKLLLSLLGLGGTLGLGSLIGEPEDITVDPSKLRTAPIETGQVFSPTQPTTVYTDYDVPITPYQAAEGGIIGYREGGFTGSPHGEGPFYTGEDEGQPFPEGLKDELMKYLFEKYMQEHMRNKEGGGDFRRVPPYLEKYEDPRPPMEAADGGVMDLRRGGASNGPGTGTSDSIPAMLSDGEFVMTAKAVRGAGGGDRREGAKKMYEAMDRLEARG
jgi:hypothetical protein